jgi:hypothetical protein
MAANALMTKARGLPARMAAFFVGVAEGLEVLEGLISVVVVGAAPALRPPPAVSDWIENVVLRGTVMPVPVMLAM